LKNSQVFYRGHTSRAQNGYSESSIIEGEIVDEDSDKSLK
jgi:hypothetical protein